MYRGYRWNESKHGFHAFGRHLDSRKAQSVISSFSRSKGFFHPDSDTHHRILPLPYASFPIGFQDRDYHLYMNGTEEALCPPGYFIIVSPLIPWSPFTEKWPWHQIRKTILSDIKYGRFYFSIETSKNEHTRIHGEKISYVVSCSLYTNSVSADDVGKVWSATVSVSPLKEWRGTARPGDDAHLLEQVSEIARNWAKLAGLSNALQNEEDPERGGSRIWRVKPARPSGYRGPFLSLDSWYEGDEPPWPEFVIPRENPALLPLKPNIKLAMADLETAMKAYESAFQSLFGGDSLHQMTFSLLDPELPEFKKQAEPLFGSPWLQGIGGFAQPGYVPRMDDNIPDWSIQPVAYFKILGSWRTIDLLKEPEGWRFLVTGRYTKDPLKHRHIRDELARKAGMTSETLWEPQEAGEGWLGVPG